MKFLCIPCDEVMGFEERQLPGDGTMGVVFACRRCGSEVAMLTNPMETQLVSSLGVKIGGREVPEQPLELTRTFLADGKDEAFVDTDRATSPRVRWSDDATHRLAQVPSFVRGMVKRIYTDYASERGIPEITPAVMDRARTDLGLEGM
ncbi:MAG TPA: PCP reductase family protein [Longimicrobiaceae bacterium]|nr:PCP reductase family protein [Longimicrobiaceae bacterium]